MRKMKKTLFILPLLALAAVSCSPQEDMIFENSAAERLDISRTKAMEKLVADGGLWAMEYFSNPDEPGYVMLFRFDKNGSVEVSANHKWLNNEFRQERSLWTVNSDNGTVLSFNSYNSLFHIFSDPADITGPNSPKNPDTGGDIDETGTGHEGDYEFMVMADTGANAMRMLGKKRGYNIYMYRLPSDTNEKEYLENLANKVNLLDSKFKTFILTDGDGAEYEVTGLSTGVLTQFPRSVYDANGNLIAEGDAVTQTTSANGIFTYSGFRFAEKYEAKKADDSEWELPELFWAEDGTLVNTEEGLRLSAPSPAENMNDVNFKWKIDPTTFTGKLLEAYNAASNAVIAELGAKNKIGDLILDWAMDSSNKMSHRLNGSLGTKKCYDYYSVVEKKGNSITAAITSSNSTAEKYNTQIPALKAFKELLLSSYDVTNYDPMNPTKIHFALKSDSNSGFDVNLQ